MSVVVVTTFPGAQLEKFREVYERHTDTMQAIVAESRQKGALHHAFATDANGEVVVVDEWESMADFEAFFAAQEDIRKVVGEIGLTGAPSSVGYEIIDTPDRF